MLDGEGAIGAEFVAAVVAVGSAVMGGVADEVPAVCFQRDAVEEPWRRLGEKDRKASLRFLEDVASLGAEGPAINQAKLAPLLI